MNQNNFSTKRLTDALSSTYHLFIINESKTEFNNLITCLEKLLPNIPVNEWPKRINYGGVYVNGKNAKYNSLLTSPAKIEYYEPKLPIDIADKAYKKFELKNNIIFEDQYLIALFKPSGVHVQPAKEQQHLNMRVSIEKYTKTNIHLPSRLDFSTSGIIICSKSKKTHNLLQRIFEERKITKKYLALTNNVAWENVSVRAGIIPNKKHRILRTTCINSKKNALTHFKKIADKNNSSLILANPITGRTHQIRVHLSSIGSPIIGDNFYNGSRFNQLCLMSYSISFVHPITDKEVLLKVPNNLFPKWLIEFNDLIQNF